MRFLLCVALSACLCALVLVGALLVSWINSSTQFSAAFQHHEREMLALAARIDARAHASGAACLNWDEFNADQQAHVGRCVELRNADFVDGTLVVYESAYLKQVEDIEFSPNADIDHHVRRPEQDELYPENSGFRHGFYAALVLLGEEIHFDGQHYLFTHSETHRAAQRFYSHIELESMPFIVGEGPANFGSDFRAAKRIIVSNGNFGRSAHFAVAGNSNGYVYIVDTYANDYETAAVRLNGVHHALLYNVTAAGSSTDVPINGEFSQTRFLLQLSRESGVPPGPALQRLATLHEQARADIEAHGQIDPVAHEEAYELFAAKQGWNTGGTAYGILITDLGAAVGPFDAEFVDQTASQNVMLRDVRINATGAAPVEFVVIVDENDQFVHDAVGGLWNLDRISRDYGSLGADPIVSAVMEFLDARDSVHPLLRARLGRPNVPQALRNAVAADGAPLDTTFATLLANNNWRVAAGTDGMGHVNKGAMALRVQSSRDVYLVDVNLGDVANVGAEAFSGSRVWFNGVVDPETYDGVDDLGHPAQFPMVGYHGNDARALAVAASVNVENHGIRAGEIVSVNGNAVPVQFIHHGDDL